MNANKEWTFTKYNKFEGIFFWTILSAIIIPIRVLIFYFISDNWYLLIGILFLIFSLITVFSKKKKLGWFGRAYIRQFSKLYRGKKQFLVFGLSIFIIFCAASIVFLINEGNTTYSELKDQVYESVLEYGIDLKEKSGIVANKENIPINMQNIKNIHLEEMIKALAVTFALIDSAFDGWVSFFWTTILVTEVEVVGILLITKLSVSSSFTKNKGII